MTIVKLTNREASYSEEKGRVFNTSLGNDDSLLLPSAETGTHDVVIPGGGYRSALSDPQNGEDPVGDC